MSGLEFIDWSNDDDDAEEIVIYDIPAQKKTKTIFQFLSALTDKKEKLDFSDTSVSKGYNQFMINRWLSMNEFTLMFVEDINTMNLTDEQHFDILFSILPKRKFYFDYVKNNKSLSNDDYKYISDYFEISIKDAKNYSRILSVDDINGILTKYRYGENGKQTIEV